MKEGYRGVVIGGGPAGITAGLYCARSGLDVVLIERGVIGGQITNAAQVENYPGFPQGISGIELGQRMHEQATGYGLETLFAEVIGHLVSTSEGDFIAKSVIIASGSQFRKLSVPGEAELAGKGVSYCATCDGPFFRDKAVAVIGGGDTALTEAIYLSKFASKVSIIHRRDELRASKVLQKKAETEPKIDFVWNAVVDRIEGEGTVRQLRLRNTKDGIISLLPADGVFIAVGVEPETGYLQGILPLDEKGRIITNEVMETRIPGILAAGDVRHNSARQAITAAGDGATAALSAERFVSSL